VDHLRDWCGEATILPPRLNYELSPRYNGAPAVKWCGIEVSRVWRCGNRGNVASALIEKPARGDFLPIVDGGYSLQYSPLMEYREGKGSILFCQMDVTGRTEDDPAATRLVRNILSYVSLGTRPSPPSSSRPAVYVGDEPGRRYLTFAGVAAGSYDGGVLSPDQVLIVATGGGKKLAANKVAVADFLKAGGHLLALGLDQTEANTFLPFKVDTKKAEHIAAYFEPPAANSFLAGIAPADVHNRDPRELPLVSAGATPIGDGVLAQQANVVFCQLPPYAITNVDGAAHEPLNLKRTYRRTSFVLTRILANLGIRAETPLLSRFATPVAPEQGKPGPSVTRDTPGRWLQGLYLDQPEDWDDPYRFFRW
jgi:hypothetical protein